jgi:lipopolysaccharide/colanic/teichoic acid biosynthesis glycosyltransferase
MAVTVENETRKKLPDVPAEIRPSSTRYTLIKRIFDLGVAVVMLVPSAPIIALCALAVRLNSRGSPLYTQKRLGLRGQIITIYKIRTMYHNSEWTSGPVWSGPGDPRVTPVGRILRACHLDELPQLINILRGEMSLIGPRPERPEIIAQIERALPRYGDRLLVRPGLTGLAQVLQAPDTDLDSVHRKLKFDLFYLEQIGLSLDLRILLATWFHLLRVPAHRIARIFRFPDEPIYQLEHSLEGKHGIPTSSKVKPFYVN